MSAEQAVIRIKDAAEARRLVEEGGHADVKVGLADIDGILRGKYLSRDKFVSALEKGFGFCDVIVGWDSNDQLYDNVTYTGWHTAYPDAPVRLLPETGRILPFENDIPFFLCELSEAAEAICPRGLLRRVLRQAEDLGFAVSAAFEYEFFVFDETPDSVRAKGYRDLKPLTPGYFGYSVLRSSVHAEFYRELLDTCRAMDMPHRGPPHRDRAGRAGGGDHGRRGAPRRRQGGPVQDLHQGDRAAAGADGDLHGQVVERLAGTERPHPHLAEGPRRRPAASSMTPTPSAASARPCATSSAGSSG